MKKAIALALVAAFFLAGCETQEESKARNEQALPEGCRIIDMDYGDLRAAVICDGRKTTTSLRTWDETTMVYMSDGKGGVYMMPQTIHHSTVSATIEPPGGF